MKKLLLTISMGFLLIPSAYAATSNVNGQAIFDKNCSVCHSVNPPPKAAPPIVPLATRYRQAFPAKQDGVKHIAAFLKAPSKNKAIDQNAVSRFGLMPPIAISEKELQTVADWVWEQYNPAMRGGRGFGGQGQRQMKSF